MRAITFTLCLCLLFTQAYAGPFGTEMGDKPEKFGKTFNDLSPERGIRVTPPKQHSTFTIYELRFADDGLASVTALSDYYKRDRFASGAKSDYATLKKQLTEKYGQPLKEPSIFPKASIWAKSPHPAGPSTITLWCFAAMRWNCAICARTGRGMRRWVVIPKSRIPPS